MSATRKTRERTPPAKTT
jgi:hypothetical protein